MILLQAVGLAMVLIPTLVILGILVYGYIDMLIYEWTDYTIYGKWGTVGATSCIIGIIILFITGVN